MKTYLSALLAAWALPSIARAELRSIAVEVIAGPDKRISVNIHSDVDAEKKHGLEIREATAILKQAKGWGSSVGVAVVTDGVDLGRCLPLLQAISENVWLELEVLKTKRDLGDNILRHFKLTAKSGDKSDPPITTSKRVDPGDLSAKLDGSMVTMSFKVRQVNWISGGVPIGATRSFGIEADTGEGGPRLRVLVIGELAAVMERSGFAPPQSNNPMVGRFIEAEGKIRVNRPPKNRPDQTPSYLFRISDWKGFQISPLRK